MDYIENADKDDDGIIDTYGFDTNGDGVSDLVEIDNDQDGLVDLYVSDTDGDGEADNWVADSNHNGVDDYYETTPGPLEPGGSLWNKAFDPAIDEATAPGGWVYEAAFNEDGSVKDQAAFEVVQHGMQTTAEENNVITTGMEPGADADRDGWSDDADLYSHDNTRF